MSISKTCNSIFQLVIDDYHLQDFVDDMREIMTYTKSSEYMGERMIRTENTNITLP